MSDDGKYGIEERKCRWRDFLSPDSEPQHLFLIDFDLDAPPRPWPWPESKAERIEWAWQTYERHVESAQWLRDDSIPFLNPYTGTEIFAEAFGCAVHRASDNMPFALPMICRAEEVAKLQVPDLDVAPLALLFEMADELKRRAGNGALMKLVDIQSPMDIGALIWDKSCFYLAFIQAPEAVCELAAKVGQLLTAFLDEWFARYGTEFIAHFPAYYMPQGMTLSEDEVGVVNRDMFEGFFLPELIELSQRYGGIGIHCCADSKHQWESFCKIPDLRLLNLVQPANVLREAYAFFADRTSQMHSWCGAGPAWTWPKKYPEGSRVVIHTTATTREEAERLSEKLWEACGRA